jgi:lysophospholipase L1-like esterase
MIKRKIRLAVVYGCLWGGVMSLVAAEPATNAPDTNASAATITPEVKKQVLEPPDVAAVRVGHDGQPHKGIMVMHEKNLARGKAGPIDVLFIGDSITFNFSGNLGKEVWAKYYKSGPLKVANFGVGGDGTQHVLWRIENGELDGIHPKVVVLMIGTNNIGVYHNAPEDILKGETKIVDEIHAKLPQSKLILLGIFPRATAYMGKVKAVNEELAKLDDGKMTRYLDIGPKFKLPDDMTKDMVHINGAGYQVWAETMQPLLEEMMK